MERFIALLYYPLHLLIVTIFTFVLSNRYNRQSGLSSYCDAPSNQRTTAIIVILCIIAYGLRPENGVFVDMTNTVYTYHNLYENTPFVFDWSVDNKLYDNLMHFFGSYNLGTTAFFTVIAAIYFGCTYLGIKKMFLSDRFAAYLVFLAAFSTYSYATNGVKAGSAAAIFILALAYWDNLKVSIPLVFISLGFHHSMAMPIGAFILCQLYNKPKLYFFVWCVSVLLAAAHVSYFQNLFAGFSDDIGSSYLNSEGGDDSYLTGFRPDFILYSSAPVLVGYYAIFKKGIRSKAYSFLLNFYLITNSVWMLCMYASFTNRIAYLSWFVYPLVLIYPFLNENMGPRRYKIFYRIMWLHLAFTIFMQGVYYGHLFRFLQ